MMQQSKPSRRIPDFAGRDEEAAFWDTHDITDYLDELEPVNVEFAAKLSAGITISLPPEYLNKLHEQAEQQGVSSVTLAQRFVIERLEAAERSA